VIPKAHSHASARQVTDADGALVAHIFAVIAKLAEELKLENGYRVVTNIGNDAGQTVHHMHFHLLGGHALGAMA
jgi:histidine triad (HIT) family protein